MTDLDDLTPARRKALHTIGRAEQRGIRARYSNTTTEPDAENPSAYHQAADSLVDLGLALVVNGPSGKVLELTTAGWELFTELVGGEPAEIDPSAPTPDDLVGEPVDGPSEDDYVEGDGDDLVAIDPTDPLVPGPQRVPDFAGHRVAELATKVSGTTDRIRRPLDIGEEIIVIGVVTCDGISYGGDDSLKRTQTAKGADLYEIDGPLAHRFLNDVRHRWDQAHLADPLPFKQEGDEALADALGLTGEHDPVVAVFADASRAVWPDDFHKDADRPRVGERWDVPGGEPDELVVELVDCASGRVLDTWDDHPEGAFDGVEDEKDEEE